MPDIKSIQDQIHARLAELEQLIKPLRAEAEQLSKLAASFTPTAAPTTRAAKPARSRAKTTRKPAAPASRTATAPRRAKRGRPTGGGNRAQQAIEQIAKQPGITASQLATRMGIGPNYLYRVLPQLQSDAKITKQGKGYYPAGTIKAATHKNGQGVTA